MNKPINRITLKNGIVFVKNHFIYEIFYKNIEIGYVTIDRVKQAIKAIILDGFYDGRNYSIRMNNIDNGKNPY